jgi:predicted amidohydrolase
MQDYACSKGCAVAGSVSTHVDGTYRNRFFFVFPDGHYQYYDKHHLFTYAGEHERYTAGEERVVVEHAGFRILLQVCYDLRFPVFARNRMVDGKPDYDLILYVASWPQQRIDAWDSLLKARAIENVCYVAGVNRVGEDPHCQYCGASAIINPYGEEMESCGVDKECAVSAVIDMEKLMAFRKKFPVLEDRD